MGVEADRRERTATGWEERTSLFRPPRAASILRRVADIAVSAPAILLLSPLLLLIAILVRLDSPGPILFRQMRIGRDRRDRHRNPRSPERRGAVLYGKPFALLKFRTMHADARERFPELYRYMSSPEELRTIPIKVLVADKDAASARQDPSNPRELLADPRVTRIGRFLRTTSLDELPNLWNVLKGDMHLVGPRPDIADNIRYYTPEELEILRVKPGVTGLAQVKGRGRLTFHETNTYDLEYIRNRSLVLDLKIFLKTFTALWRRDGAC